MAQNDGSGLCFEVKNADDVCVESGCEAKLVIYGELRLKPWF